MKFPTAMLDFMPQLPDDGACRAYLKKVRWPNGFVCSRCQGTNASYVASRRLRQCAVFRYQAAWTMLHKLRSALARRAGQLLKGVVGADEAFVGGSRSGGKRGRGAPNKSIVVVMVEQREHTAGSAALEIVPDASWERLGPTVRGRIEGANTTVVTDGHRGYSQLRSAGVDHEATTLATPETASEVLPWAHTIVSNLKDWLRGIFRGVNHKHLDRHLKEFTYRLNRRWNEDKLFYYLTPPRPRG